MAGEPATDLEARLTEIQEDLSLWCQLPDHDKKQFKALVDHKIAALTGYARDKDIKKSKFLKHALELRKTMSVAGFDLGSADAMVSKEVERLLLNAGLQYEEASSSYSPHRKFLLKNVLHKSSTHIPTNMETKKCYITYSSDSNAYHMVNREDKTVFLKLPIMHLNPTYAGSSNKICFQSMGIGLEMSTITEAQELIRDIIRQTNRSFYAIQAYNVEHLYSHYLR